MTKLAFYRRKAGLTQESLGKKLGVSKQLISAWENFAAVIDPKHVDKLKSALDLSEAEIIDIVADSVFTKENQKKSEPLPRPWHPLPSVSVRKSYLLAPPYRPVASTPNIPQKLPPPAPP